MAAFSGCYLRLSAARKEIPQRTPLGNRDGAATFKDLGRATRTVTDPDCRRAPGLTPPTPCPLDARESLAWMQAEDLSPWKPLNLCAR